MSIMKVADELADKWGPALTKFAKGEGMDDFKALWAPGIVPFVVEKDGKEVVIAIGEEGSEEPITFTWDAFQTLIQKDMETAEYLKTEAECLGVLGDRMLLEVNRYNKEDKLYMNAVSLLTLNAEGLVLQCEAFGDPEVASVMEKA